MTDHRWRFSPKGKWLIDEYSRVDLPPITTLRSVATGELVKLEKADISELVAMGWRPPERFVTEGRDGNEDPWADHTTLEVRQRKNTPC